MEKRKKFLKRLSILIVSIGCFFFFLGLVEFLTPPPPPPFGPFPELRLAYTDRTDAVAVYVWDGFGLEKIKHIACDAIDPTTGSHAPLPYAIIDVDNTTTISPGDLLLIYNITLYSGWYLWVNIEVGAVPAYPSKIPYISNQTAEISQSSGDILKVENYIVEERKVFVRVEDYGKE